MIIEKGKKEWKKVGEGEKVDFENLNSSSTREQTAFHEYRERKTMLRCSWELSDEVPKELSLSLSLGISLKLLLFQKRVIIGNRSYTWWLDSSNSLSMYRQQHDLIND